MNGPLRCLRFSIYRKVRKGFAKGAKSILRALRYPCVPCGLVFTAKYAKVSQRAQSPFCVPCDSLVFLAV